MARSAENDVRLSDPMRARSSASLPDAPLLEAGLVHRLSSLRLLLGRQIAGSRRGERRSRRRGQSVEFADYRNYVAGDDLRFLDWNLYGRLERLFLRVFLEEQELELTLLVDASPSMDFGLPNKYRFACQVAAALGYVGLSGQDHVTALVGGGGSVRQIRSLRGRTRLGRLTDHLWPLRPEPASQAQEALFSLCRTAGERLRHGLCVLISDLMLPLETVDAALVRLVRPGVETHVVQVLSPQELNPQLIGDLRLTDAETSAAMDITSSPGLLRRYRARLHEHTQGLDRLCRRRAMRFMQIDTATALDAVLLSVFRRRGVLG